MINNTSKKHINYLSIGFLLLIWLFWGFQSHPQSTLRVYFLDVGQGDSEIICTPNGHTILIDAGRIHGETDEGRRTVVPALRTLGINDIDLMIWTHPHADHIGGMHSVLRSVNVEKILDTKSIGSKSPVYDELLKDVLQKHIQYQITSRGEQFELDDGVILKVLAPTGTPSEDLNEDSIVVKLIYRKSSILLQGDAGQDIERRILANGDDPQAQVIKIGHHGSKTASSPKWISAVHPMAAVISVGRYNLFGHPSSQTLKTLASKGVMVFRTDEEGSIEFESDGQNIKMKPVGE